MSKKKTGRPSIFTDEEKAQIKAIQEAARARAKSVKEAKKCPLPPLA